MVYTNRLRLVHILLLVFVVTTWLTGCGGGGGSSSPVVYPGYLASCRVSDRLARWTSMPIPVYFDTTSVPVNWSENDVQEFRQGMADWAAASGGIISFQEVNSAQAPCITVKWVKDSPMGNPDAAGITRFQSVTIGNKQYFDVIPIEIATTRFGSGISYTPTEMGIISTHELGHALGLWGHSDQPTDIMYAKGSILTRTISARDTETLLALYSMNPAITQVPAGYHPTERGRTIIDFP